MSNQALMYSCELEWKSGEHFGCSAFHLPVVDAWRSVGRNRMPPCSFIVHVGKIGANISCIHKKRTGGSSGVRQ
eukprot:3090862-Amphidinium_carterae.1